MTGEGPDPSPGGLRIRPLAGLPEIAKGDDLAAMIAARAPDLCDGDVVVVSSKVVSKSEGRVVAGLDRDAAIRAETVRVVARRGPTRIVETRHGFVMAAAGVDASNVEPGSVVLLPEDPDSSARQLRHGLRDRLGVRIGVVVTDTFGRPWRNGQTDLAIGAAGVPALVAYGGQVDGYGNPLTVTAPALADELAAAADLVKGKLTGIPVAVVSGIDVVTAEDGPGVRALVRDAEADMFRLGARDAMRQAVRVPVDGAPLGSAPIDRGLDRDAVEALVAEANASPPTLPADHEALDADHGKAGPATRADPRFVLLDGGPRTEALREAALPGAALPGAALPGAALPGAALPGAGAFPALVEVVAVHQNDPAATHGLLRAGASISRLQLALAVEGFQARWVDSANPGNHVNRTSQPEVGPVPDPLGWLLISVAETDGQ